MVLKFKETSRIVLALFWILISYATNAQNADSIKKYSSIIKQHIYNDYKGMFRQPKGSLKYPFITPGSDQYANDLWDWDSWWSNVALRQILSDKGIIKDKNEAVKFEQGCILNFLDYASTDGYIPIVILSNVNPRERKECRQIFTRRTCTSLCWHSMLLFLPN